MRQKAIGKRFRRMMPLFATGDFATGDLRCDAHANAAAAHQPLDAHAACSGAWEALCSGGVAAAVLTVLQELEPS